MKPLLLQGHDRSITQIRYNREGDLLFSCSKDKCPTVWFSANGERLGTYGSVVEGGTSYGHNGVVWAIDVKWDSTRIITGSGDASWRLWDTETAKTLNTMATPTGVRSVGFSYSGNEFFYVTDIQGKLKDSLLVVKDLRSPSHMSDEKSILSIPSLQNRISAAVWGPFDETIVTGHSNGDISKVDMRTKDFAATNSKAHTNLVTDIQKSKDDIMFVASSKDTTAKLFDSTTLECLKTYKADRPVNSAAISPIKQHILLGGGQEAMQVTTTDARQGRFEARFYHLVFEEEFARVKGHFGPINSVAFHPDGTSFSTGGEDGYVRVHSLDPEYFDFDLQF